MIEGIVVAVIAALLSALGYFILSWFSQMDEQISSIETSVQSLIKRVDKLENECVRISECTSRSAQLRREMFMRHLPH